MDWEYAREIIEAIDHLGSDLSVLSLQAEAATVRASGWTTRRQMRLLWSDELGGWLSTRDFSGVVGSRNVVFNGKPVQIYPVAEIDEALAGGVAWGMPSIFSATSADGEGGAG